LKLLKVTASNVGGTTAMPTRERCLGRGGRAVTLDDGGAIEKMGFSIEHLVLVVGV
jgi:hypothetical protein